jgi:thiol reductant ABC exporter CydC subunit
MRDLAWIVRLARGHRRSVALAVLAGIGAAAAAVGLTATSAWLISRAAERPPVLYLMVAIVAVRAFGVGRGVLRYAERLASHDAAFRILVDLRVTVYRRLQTLAPAGLAAFRGGDLLARLVADVDGLADVWLRVLLPYAITGAVAVAAVGLVWWLVPVAGAALALSLLFVAAAAPWAAIRVARRAEQRVVPVRGALADETLELLRGASELIVADTGEARLAHLATLDANLAAAEARSAVGTGVGALLAGLAGGAAIWIALASGIGAVHAASLGGVALAVVVLTPIAAHELVAGLAPAAQQLPRLAAAASRVTAILSIPDPVAEPADPARLPAGPYGLRVHDVHARYAADGREVLSGIGFELRPGGRALIWGPSGSGKSTLGAVLLRLLDPSSGSVELVGANGAADLTRLAGDDVRRVIGLCAQDPHIFDTSVRENLRVARPEASENEIIAALRTARLDGWVASLPDGLDTSVGEHGARLSGGQRQRIELARTILADRPLVIFDEPTEHLDPVTADALTADLLASSAGRTVLVITHRPALAAAVAPDVTVDLGSPADSDEPPAGPGAHIVGERPTRPGRKP